MFKSFNAIYIIFAAVFICFGINHAIHAEWKDALIDLLIALLDFHMYQLRAKITNTTTN